MNTMNNTEALISAVPLARRVMPLALGTKTEWGTIDMIGTTGGERYYWMTDKHGCVSMIPAFIVERHNAALTGAEGHSPKASG